MEISNYDSSYHDAVFQLWNSVAVNQGYAPLEKEDFNTLLVGHSCFSEKYAFVLKEDKEICGFICGCVEKTAYITCLVLRPEHDTEENTEKLLRKLEEAFWESGMRKIQYSFFNPMRLPWIIPGTQECQHNNVPGIAIDLPLYERALSLGYRERTRECAMFLRLNGFQIPGNIVEKEHKAAEEGYTIEWYDSGKHQGLSAMVDSMNNPMWSEEIPYAAEHINMLVAVRDGYVAGFAGPVYPEKTGRGYFAGIAVAKEHEKHHLGTILFYRLCQEEEKSGSRYMSLFTGVENRAQKIYLGAGFQVKRIFAVVEKELDG